MTPAAKKQTEKIQDAILEPATPAELIQALIEALGHDAAEVASMEITARYTRVLGKDRSLRSHKIDWIPKEEK